MLSIGEFSRICEVTPKTLRYYEEIGLLYPEEISLENGYRYYSIKQLEKMLLINRLKQSLYQDWKDGEITQQDYRDMKADCERQTISYGCAGPAER